VQPIANARLVGNLTHQLNLSLAVAGQSQVQLSLQRGELRRAGQTLVQRTKLREECDELLGDKRGIDSAAKSPNANSNLNRQPIVVVILSDGLTLVAQHLYLDALML
jgi:hypothetical protein